MQFMFGQCKCLSRCRVFCICVAAVVHVWRGNLTSLGRWWLHLPCPSLSIQPNKKMARPVQHISIEPNRKMVRPIHPTKKTTWISISRNPWISISNSPCPQTKHTLILQLMHLKIDNNILLLFMNSVHYKRHFITCPLVTTPSTSVRYCAVVYCNTIHKIAPAPID
jgi:hypothetical protein